MVHKDTINPPYGLLPALKNEAHITEPEYCLKRKLTQPSSKSAYHAHAEPF
jgi:hypothetical protein